MHVEPRGWAGSLKLKSLVVVRVIGPVGRCNGLLGGNLGGGIEGIWPSLSGLVLHPTRARDDESKSRPPSVVVPPILNRSHQPPPPHRIASLTRSFSPKTLNSQRAVKRNEPPSLVPATAKFTPSRPPFPCPPLTQSIRSSASTEHHSINVPVHIASRISPHIGPSRHRETSTTQALLVVAAVNQTVASSAASASAPTFRPTSSTCRPFPPTPPPPPPTPPPPPQP